MIRLPHILLCLWALCMLIGCAGDGYTPALRTADSLMNDSPSVALAMLDSLKGEAQGWSKARRMRYHLLTMKAQNKAYVDFTSDSLAKDVVEYYDNHGTANDRLLAHYLLGCVYRDLGESPHAVDCFLDAAACADTTARDCDYYTLSSVYSQMADQYRMQLLLSYEIDARWKASHFAALAKDTLHMIYNMDLASGAYILLNKVDSGEIVKKQVIDLYNKYGYMQKALQASTVLMYLYVDIPEKLSIAKELIDKYETEYSLFDKEGNLPPTKRQFFYYKGRYYDQMNQLDSAEYYYRKIYHPKMFHSTKDAMYRGLLNVFQKRHIPDSIAKYAQLFCQANDSSIAKKDQELTAKMASSYRYNRYQKESSERAKQVYGIRIILILVSILFVLIVVFSVAIGRRFIKRQREKESIQKRIHEQDQERLRRIHLEKEEELRQTHHQELELLEKDYQQRQTELRKEHERNYKTLIEKHHQEQEDWLQYQKQKEQEVDSLKEKIAHLRLPENVANSEALMDAPIVKTIIELANKPVRPITKDEWRQLGKTIGKYCPQLIDDLNQQNASKDMIKVCFLTVLNVRHNEQAALMDLNKQDVTNIKTSLNRKIFGEKTSRTIYQNLLNRYHIYSL